MILTPYVSFPGTAEEAMNFYKSVFGGELMLSRWSAMPAARNSRPRTAAK